MILCVLIIKTVMYSIKVEHYLFKHHEIWNGRKKAHLKKLKSLQNFSLISNRGHTSASLKTQTRYLTMNVFMIGTIGYEFLAYIAKAGTGAMRSIRGGRRSSKRMRLAWCCSEEQSTGNVDTIFHSFFWIIIIQLICHCNLRSSVARQIE